MNPAMQHRIETLCETARTDSDRDPRRLHDELVKIRLKLVTDQISVPRELKETVEDLEATILEDFYDNLPV